MDINDVCARSLTLRRFVVLRRHCVVGVQPRRRARFERGGQPAVRRRSIERNRNDGLRQRSSGTTTSRCSRIASIAGCAVLLWMQGRHRIVVEPGQTPETTGHVWDEDLSEYKNPMPRWWMSCSTSRSCSRSSTWRCIPGLGTHSRARSAGPRAGNYEAERQGSGCAATDRCIDGYLKQDVAAVAGDDPRRAHRAAPVPEQLRAMPRLGRARQRGLPEPRRRRLAVRR